MTPSREAAIAFVALAIAGIVALWTRLIALNAGLWNDEAYSAWVYVRGGPPEILFGTYVPNNHLLFNLLTWGTTKLLGKAEWVHRLWSVVPGLAALTIAVAWAWRRLGRTTAVALAVLVTVSPVHLELAPQARGYGLGFLAGALLLVTAARLCDGKRSAAAFAAFGLAGLIGILTLPVFAVPFLVQAAVVAVAPGAFRRKAVAVLAVVASAAIVYLPVLSGIWIESGQEYGSLVTISSALTGPCSDLLCPAFELLGVDPRGWLPLLVFWALVALAARRLRWQGEGWLLATVSAPIVGTYACLALLHMYAVPRFLSYLLIPTCTLVAIGMVELLEVLGRWRVARAPATVLLLAIAATWLASAWERGMEYASIPLEGYREAVAVARGAGMPRLIANSTLRTGYVFYADPTPVEFPAPEDLERILCAESGPFAFIDYPLHGAPVDLACLRARDAGAIPIPQRAGEPSKKMTVYLVGR